jgi:hypothetical protein
MQPLFKPQAVDTNITYRPTPCYVARSRPNYVGKTTRRSMQVSCASNVATQRPSARKQSISRNAHRAERAKGVRPFQDLPEGALTDMSLLGKEEDFAEGEVLQAAARPSAGLLILLEGERIRYCKCSWLH